MENGFIVRIIVYHVAFHMTCLMTAIDTWVNK